MASADFLCEGRTNADLPSNGLLVKHKNGLYAYDKPLADKAQATELSDIRPDTTLLFVPTLFF